MRLAHLTPQLDLWAVVLLVLASTATLHAACSSDDVGPQSRMVGGRCVTDNDCVKRCITGTEFPGGYCTVTCAASSDCPGGSACVASNGGICLATCQVPSDCDDYGPDYQCNRQTSQTPGAGPLACAGG
jgi:serine protease